MNQKLFKVIHAGVYPFDILFTIGTTEDEIVKHLTKKCSYNLDKEEIEHIAVTAKSGRTVQFKNGALLLWVKNDSWSILSHEIFHAVELIMLKINTPLNEHTSEPYAYLIEYLTRQIIRITNEDRTRKKSRPSKS